VAGAEQGGQQAGAAVGGRVHAFAGGQHADDLGLMVVQVAQVGGQQGRGGLDQLDDRQVGGDLLGRARRGRRSQLLGRSQKRPPSPGFPRGRRPFL